MDIIVQGFNQVIKRAVFTLSIGGYLVPGGWVAEIILFLALFLITKQLFKEQDLRAKIYYKSISVLGILEMIRILFVI